jgi:hypothetical protein
MSSTDLLQDYVDDSEPERKKIRLRKAEDRKQRARQKESPPFDHPPSVEINGLHSFLLQSLVIDAVRCSEGTDGVLIEVTPAFVENSAKGLFGVPLGLY